MYECMEFINGRRANDKSRVDYVSRRSTMWLSIGAKEEEEDVRDVARSWKRMSSFDEILPSFSRWVVLCWQIDLRFCIHSIVRMYVYLYAARQLPSRMLCWIIIH